MRRARTAVAAGLTGVTLMGAGAAVADAAAPKAAVRVQVQGKFVCTGAVIAKRYVLTAGRCVSAGSRAVPTRRITVVGRSPKTEVIKVAAIRFVGGSRPSKRVDLALLQLTSPTRVAPIRLAARTPRPKRRGRASIRGWRSASGAATTRGALRPAAACGKATRAATLCAITRARPPARRCTDAAGALLVVRGRLAGIGVRSPRGCRKRPAVRFTDLTRPQAAPLTTPVVTPVTTTTPVQTLVPFVGVWEGPITEDRPDPLPYTARIAIDRTGRVQEQVGSSAYASSCTGNVAYAGPLADGSVTLLETIVTGQELCVSGGTLTLALVPGQNAITYSFFKDDASGRSSGILQRVG